MSFEFSLDLTFNFALIGKKLDPREEAKLRVYIGLWSEDIDYDVKAGSD